MHILLTGVTVTHIRITKDSQEVRGLLPLAMDIVRAVKNTTINSPMQIQLYSKGLAIRHLINAPPQLVQQLRLHRPN
jgi:hypothetical protein